MYCIVSPQSAFLLSLRFSSVCVSPLEAADVQRSSFPQLPAVPSTRPITARHQQLAAPQPITALHTRNTAYSSRTHTAAQSLAFTGPTHTYRSPSPLPFPCLSFPLPLFLPPVPCSPLLPPVPSSPCLICGDLGNMATATIKELETAVKTMQDALKLLKDSGAQPKNTQISSFLLTLTPQIVSVTSSLAAMMTAHESAKRVSCKLSDTLTRETRQNRDLIDDCHQVNLTGRIVLNIQSEELRKAAGLEEQTNYVNLNIDVILGEINKRYSVNIKSDDISDARRTSQKGAVTITFWNRKVNSPYHALCLAMKSPGSNTSGKDLYANFALTPRRGELLWNVRQLWKNKEIQ